MDKFKLIKRFSTELTSTLELAELAKAINNFSVIELLAEHSSIIIAGSGKYPRSSAHNEIIDEIESNTFQYIMKVQKCLSIARPCSEYMLKDVKGINSFKFFIIAMPLITKNKILGSLNLYFSGKPDDDFFDFLNLFAELSSSSIMNSLAYKNLETESITDKLTGLYNRRNFDKEIKSQIEKYSSMNTPISVMMLDIDDFKKYNDSYGHQKGDMLLEGIGKAVNLSLSGKGMAFRYGGEELAVILPEASPDEAFEAAEEIRNKIKSSCGITASIGLVTCMNSSCPASVMVKEADKALYKAKKSGKNKVSSSIIIDKALNPVDVQEASEIGKKK